MVVDAMSSVCDLGILDSLNGDAVQEIVESWNGFCLATEALLNGKGDFFPRSKLVLQARTLCNCGLESLVEEHFAGFLEETFEKNGASKFWEHFDAYSNVAAREMSIDPIQKDSIQQVLCKALEEISMEKQYQEKFLLLLIDVVQSYKDSMPGKRQNSGGSERLHLLSKYQSMVSSVLMATLPPHFPGRVASTVPATNMWVELFSDICPVGDKGCRVPYLSSHIRKFVTMMIKNLGCLNLDQIHNALRIKD